MQAETYQVEVQYQTAATGADGLVGWKIWSADGMTLLHSLTVSDHDSTRQPNAVFLGHGNVDGTTTETEVYFDAFKVSADGWVQPLRR